MSSTCMVIPMPTPSRTCRLLATVAALTLFSAWTASASAAIPWHPDLATARRASEISQRPVLAIFTASWSSATTTLDRTTLASDEAVALIGACFEPVCVDVDANPEATRRLGITKVPTACILNADEQLLTKFELPETPAGFVAAAARAAQEAALASATRPSSQGTTTEPAVSLREFADISGGGSALPTFGSESGKGLRAATTADARGTVPPGGKAINAVAAKVRMLSDFASDDGVPASGSESAIAASFRESTISQPAAPPAAPAVMPPTASTPTAPAVSTPEPTAIATASMPAEAPATLASSSALGNTVAQTPLTIEPAPTTATAPSHSTAGAAPWLGLPHQNQPPTPTPMPTTPAPATAMAAAPAAGPAASAATSGFPGSGSQSLADAKASAAQQPQAETNPATPAQPNSEASATALADTKPQKPSATSSLLSALQKPFSLFSKPAAAKPAPAPSGTSTAASTLPQTAATPAEPDVYGSMPVGLEGYCPVTLAERGVWVEGRAQWGVRHRGRTYLFATAEQQKAFLADPDRYAPALSGDDPVMAFDAGKSTPGQRRYGVTYQARTYLFSSTETRDAFAANPQRYTSGAMVAEHRTPASGPVVR